MKPNKLKKIKKSVKLQYRNIDISTFGLLSVAYPAELDDLFNILKAKSLDMGVFV